jgi:hypothetical protein
LTEFFCQVERRFHSRESNHQPLLWDLAISPPSSSMFGVVSGDDLVEFWEIIDGVGEITGWSSKTWGKLRIVFRRIDGMNLKLLKKSREITTWSKGPVGLGSSNKILTA